MPQGGRSVLEFLRYIRQAQEVTSPEQAPAAGNDHERIHCADACPAGWKANQVTLLVKEVDSLLTPDEAKILERELATNERVERVGYLENLLLNARMARSWRLFPRASSTGISSPRT